MVSRLVAKGASVLATDRNGRDALEYLQLSVQQHHQSDRVYHESGREVLFMLQKARAKVEITNQRQALRYPHQPPLSQPSSSQLSPTSASAQLDGGEEMERGEVVGDDYVVDIYCRDTMDVSNNDYSDVAAEGQGLGAGLGQGLGLESGQGQAQGSGSGRVGTGLMDNDLVQLSATATVVQVPYNLTSTHSSSRASLFLPLYTSPLAHTLTTYHPPN